MSAISYIQSRYGCYSTPAIPFDTTRTFIYPQDTLIDCTPRITNGSRT
jgi:hypothetical protein